MLQNVYMAHALKRISYASCDPELSHFSFLAREPKGQVDLQFCHVFLAESPEQVSVLFRRFLSSLSLFFLIRWRNNKNLYRNCGWKFLNRTMMGVTTRNMAWGWARGAINGSSLGVCMSQRWHLLQKRLLNIFSLLVSTRSCYSHAWPTGITTQGPASVAFNNPFTQATPQGL
jgi:hypothetical protein